MEHDAELPEVVTEAGPLQRWIVEIETPTFSQSSSLALAGSSHQVDEGLFATVVDFTLIREFPGSRDNHPFPQEEVHNWARANREALQDLVARLRASEPAS